MLSLSTLAILLGALAVMARLPGVFYPKAFTKFLKHILKEKHFLQFAAAFGMMFAVLILLNKYDFTKDWETVMSVLGWLMLVGSVCLAWYPKCFEKKVKKFLKKPNFVSFICFLGVALGVALMYLGFYVY